MNGGMQSNGRATWAIIILLGLLFILAGGAFVGIGVLETRQLERDAMRTQLDNLKRRRPAAPTSGAESKITVKPFLEEESFALAANALQRRVVGLIEETDGKLITVGVDPPVTGDEELARRVSVQVSAELTNEALQKVLYELETAVPFVFVENLGVTRKQTGDEAETDETRAAPHLSVSLNVSGYRRKGSQ